MKRTISVALVSAALTALTATAAQADQDKDREDGGATRTPIRHVVVLFQENVSFDHYFGTYPRAQNNAGENPFEAQPLTPTVNGLGRELLNNNPNKNAARD